MKEKPNRVEDLDLMLLLKAYSDGEATWNDGEKLSDSLKKECSRLYGSVAALVDHTLAPYLDQVTNKEMDAFTLHDHHHGLKVAHLMWEVLCPERRARLTPPEIALLVLSAHIHDMGMGLSKSERETRLAPDSDLWARLDIDESTRLRFEELQSDLERKDLEKSQRRDLELKLEEARTSLLCDDTRERHATRERFEELFAFLASTAEAEAALPDLEATLTFDSHPASLERELMDVCMSHNESAHRLNMVDDQNSSQQRFPTDLAVGSCNVDLRLVAAVLRIADILDFDRERTPRSLFYYLLPTELAASEHISVREWKKHLAIDQWSIEKEEIVFRATCADHVVHHTIVEFCEIIEKEIVATKMALGDDMKHLTVPNRVRADIRTKGYKYVPYRFNLDGDRIYELMMGRNLYPQPLDAVRELIQNAVDACIVRDKVLNQNGVSLKEGSERISLRYEEAGEKAPLLTIEDTGTGMDQHIIREYFLKIGRSYYTSHEFNVLRAKLAREQESSSPQITPVSEFGIGILSCFLLSHRVLVETQRDPNCTSDPQPTRRLVTLDGPTKLILLNELKPKQPGTSIKLELSRGSKDKHNAPPTWKEVSDYVRQTCISLPYDIHLTHAVDGEIQKEEVLTSLKREVPIPSSLEGNLVRIALEDQDLGVEGSIVLLGPHRSEEDHSIASEAGLHGDPRLGPNGRGCITRGGFRVGPIEGLPKRANSYLDGAGALMWALPVSRRRKRFCKVNLSRTSLVESEAAREVTLKSWLLHLVDHCDDLPAGLLGGLQFDEKFREGELLNYDWFLGVEPWSWYQLARQGWVEALNDYNLRSHGAGSKQSGEEQVQAWEAGELDELWAFRRVVGSSVCGNLIHLVLDQLGGRALMLTQSRTVAWSAQKLQDPQGLEESLNRSWQGLEDCLIPQKPDFVPYVPKHSKLLYISSFGAFNRLFEEQLNSNFDMSELRDLREAFDRHKMKGSQTYPLTERKKAALEKAGKVIGEARVASRLEKTWSIRDVVKSALGKL